MQNDFCHSSGLFKRSGFDVSHVPPVAEKIRSMRDRARQLGVFTVFVGSSYDDEVLSGTLEEIFVRIFLTGCVA